MLHLHWIHFLLLFCSRNCGALVFLAKTKETFKLSELQLVEARIQSEHSFYNYSVNRLLVDQATGSSLFRIDVTTDDAVDKGTLADTEIRRLSLDNPWIRRCDWVGNVIADGCGASEMIDTLRVPRPGSISDGWTLDYAKMAGIEKPDSKRQSSPRRQPNFTMKTILCTVSNALPVSPCLDPGKVNDRLLILYTTLRPSDHCYLIRILEDSKTMSNSFHSVVQDDFVHRWAQRPFQYSSAINISLARIVIDILSALCKAGSSGASIAEEKALLWDPTCGSGTFLALALKDGYRVEGCDRNPSAINGTIENLQFLFPNDDIEKEFDVEGHDSATSYWKQHKSNIHVSCVVANLPWGRNSVEYLDENYQILSSVRQRIAAGTPCAFVTRPSTEREASQTYQFDRAGFEVLGQAFVPSREFQLPESKKRSNRNLDGFSDDSSIDLKDHLDSQSSRRNKECLITIAKAKVQGEGKER